MNKFSILFSVFISFLLGACTTSEDDWVNIMNSVSDTVYGIADPLINYNERLVEKQNLEQLDYLNASLEANPGDLELLFQRSFVRNSVGDYYGAIEDCREVLKRSPEFSLRRNCYSRIAYNYIALKDVHGMVRAYNEMFKEFPPTPASYTGRARRRWELGDVEGAKIDYERAVLYGSNDWAAYNSRAKFRQALGNFDGAKEDYDKAVILAKDNFVPLVNRADFMREVGEYDFAIADLNKAVELGYDHKVAKDLIDEILEDKENVKVLEEKEVKKAKMIDNVEDYLIEKNNNKKKNEDIEFDNLN